MMPTARETRRASRDSVYRLLNGLQVHKQIAVANLYCESCFIQAQLENVPAVIHIEMGHGVAHLYMCALKCLIGLRASVRMGERVRYKEVNMDRNTALIRKPGALIPLAMACVTLAHRLNYWAGRH